MGGGKGSQHRREKERRRKRLERKHKNWLHLAICLLIAISLVYEGGGWVDWQFLGLSVLVELA